MISRLNNITKEGQNPPAQKFELPFYLRTSKDGVFDKKIMNLRTSGGVCHNMGILFLVYVIIFERISKICFTYEAAKQLGDFFTGIQLKFNEICVISFP